MKSNPSSSNQNPNQRETKSTKKQKQSSYVDIGSPKVPIRHNKTQPKQESLSDWAHAS
ncbi:hypothetical protein NIES4101_84870 [Calothrix sp. NIES-4101]|uniref:hypothetical protein n=1 Tax=Calothrix sp. UHCC 0171 TaxID=3110245 RepID=UPI000B604206|nr:hypothetical protein [Calothrix sp. UHCC 0171]MEA5573751.1 hypothetical protein [Calothrix sp. UHCC 0171]BAZ42518.1 hypothetical protein NIES4101_84870 [Calothrix sp. NIES-4101]